MTSSREGAIPARYVLRFDIERAGERIQPEHLRALVSRLLDPAGTHHDNIKAFTVRPPQGNLEQLDLEVTVLGPATEQRLQAAVTARMREGGTARLRDTLLRFAEPPLAELDRRSWEDLLEHASAERTVRLAFATPVVFRQGRHHQHPFPIPERVFGHYQERWNRFATDRFRCPPLFNDDVGLSVVDFAGQRDDYEDHHRDRTTGRVVTITYVGFVGEVTFELRGRRAGVQERRWLHALAGFGEFCGTGANTTIGMGVTRYLGP